MESRPLNRKSKKRPFYPFNCTLFMSVQCLLRIYAITEFGFCIFGLTWKIKLRWQNNHMSKWTGAYGLQIVHFQYGQIMNCFHGEIISAEIGQIHIILEIGFAKQKFLNIFKWVGDIEKTYLIKVCAVRSWTGLYIILNRSGNFEKSYRRKSKAK